MATLIVFRLAIKSSYSGDLEEPADADDFDTLQWWLGESECWRVRTYAIDDDIHVFLLQRPIAATDAVEATKRHYGDVIGDQFEVEIGDPRDADEVERKLADHGGAEALELAPSGRFAFWNFDGRRYRTQTTPDD